MLKLNNNTYIFADPHYDHKNIVRGETSWFYDEELSEEEIEAIRRKRCRDFDTREEMNKVIVDRINETVPETAILVCLGDWSFGGRQNIWNFRKQINCKDIHLILGNHDHHIEKGNAIPIPNTTEDEARFMEISGVSQPFPPSTSKTVPVNPNDLFSSVSHYKEARYKVDGYTYYFVLSHYAMRVWNKAHYGSIMLYGHSHGTLDTMTPYIANPTWIGDQYYVRNYRTMDVGMDTNDFYPYHIDDIVEVMRERPVGMEIDHH